MAMLSRNKNNGVFGQMPPSLARHTHTLENGSAGLVIATVKQQIHKAR
jgi:hypothetical protein